MMENQQRGKAMKKVALLVGMLSLMVVGALVGGSVAGANPLTYVTSTTTHPCTAAHPCSQEDCDKVGAHGDDCLPPETSSTTTTTRTTTVPPHGCGVAGKDGQPGNDDCATTTTPPAVSTTTPPPTSSSTTTTTETTSSTTETTTTTVPTTTTTPTPPPCSEPPCGPTPPDHELPNTGSNGALLGGLAGFLLLLSGLAIRRTARQRS